MALSSTNATAKYYYLPESVVTESTIESSRRLSLTFRNSLRKLLSTNMSLSNCIKYWSYNLRITEKKANLNTKRTYGNRTRLKNPSLSIKDIWNLLWYCNKFVIVLVCILLEYSGSHVLWFAQVALAEFFHSTPGMFPRWSSSNCPYRILSPPLFPWVNSSTFVFHDKNVFSLGVEEIPPVFASRFGA